MRHAVDTAVAGMVTLVPEGLILLLSVTYAAAALRMARAGALSQQLNAIESLASVDTSASTRPARSRPPSLRVLELVPAAGTTTDGARGGARRLRGLVRVAEPDPRRDLDGVPAGRRAGRRDRPVRLPATVERPARSEVSVTCSAPRAVPARRPGGRRVRAARGRAAGLGFGTATGPLPEDGDGACRRSAHSASWCSPRSCGRRPAPRSGSWSSRGSRSSSSPVTRRTRSRRSPPTPESRAPGRRSRATACRRATRSSPPWRRRSRSSGGSPPRASGAWSSRSAGTAATWRWSATGSTTCRP